MRPTTYVSRYKRDPEVRKPTNIRRMVDVLDALQRHPGGLSTLYLFKIVCPKATDMSDFRALLKQMYHHDYLDRPGTLNIKEAPSRWTVYRLSDSGRRLL